jgi:hypothetical protein
MLFAITAFKKNICWSVNDGYVVLQRTVVYEVMKYWYYFKCIHNIMYIAKNNNPSTNYLRKSIRSVDLRICIEPSINRAQKLILNFISLLKFKNKTTYIDIRQGLCV